MIKKPPVFDFAEFTANSPQLLASNVEATQEYLKHTAPLDDKGRYQHYDEFRHRVKAPAQPEIAWGFKKFARMLQSNNVLPLGETGHGEGTLMGRLYLTPTIQKVASSVDQQATTAKLEWMMAKVGEQHQLKYLLADLFEDEAISSSQLEGAATTTVVAKDMLRQKRSPRTADERMIIGNYLMMNYAWEHRQEPLTIEFIQSLHKLGVEGIDDDKYTPGAFRMDDSVVVADYDGDIVHQPPKAELLETRLQELCDWVNTDHNGVESKRYIHPMVKAILLHFCIGFEHPFRDGNGRVARGLFYWLMFKHDYEAFRYIAISTLLKQAATQYGKSYVYTETDGMDLTYFVDYQCGIIQQALKRFTEAYEQNVVAMQRFNSWLYGSGLLMKLSDKQKAILIKFLNTSDLKVPANTVSEELGCSYNTAASALKGMVRMGLLNTEMDGRQTLYSIKPRDEIRQNWGRKDF